MTHSKLWTSFVFNRFHQPAKCCGGFMAGRRPQTLLQAGLFTKLGGVMSEVIDSGSSLSNKQLHLIVKMG